jgi:hypothetical protein
VHQREQVAARGRAGQAAALAGLAGGQARVFGVEGLDHGQAFLEPGDPVAALEREGRLRDEGCRWISLSHEEQARRIALALGINNAFDERCETIANVLAGKTEKS